MDDSFAFWCGFVLAGFVVCATPLWDSEHARGPDITAALTMCEAHGGVDDFYVNRRSPKYAGTLVAVICGDKSRFTQDRIK